MAELRDIERRALEAVSASPMLARTLAWASVNSGTGNLAGLATVASHLADAFAGLPGLIRLVDAAPADHVGSDGTIAPSAHGQHLHLSVRPEATTRLLLTGHMDTVYPADHPFQTLTDRPDGTINGPGTADMKGGLAVMLAALEAIEAVGCDIGYDVVINSDEETGSLSSAALIAETARGKLAALTYEPALPDGTLAGARGGTGNFSIVVRGRSAHAGRNPEDGRNAIVAAATLPTLQLPPDHRPVRALHRRLQHAAIEPQLREIGEVAESRLDIPLLGPAFRCSDGRLCTPSSIVV